MPGIGKHYRRIAVALTATAALGVGLFSSLGPTPGGASSHREAPLAAADPQIDGTDLYAFVSPDNPDTVTIISNWIPLEEPAGGPNFASFAPGVYYDVDIDNDGDAKADLIYRWIFENHTRNPDTFLYNVGQVTSLDDPDLNFYQTYDLLRINVGHGTEMVTDDAFVVPANVGAASMPDYASLFQAGTVRAGCGSCKTWAGQADDSFFLDLRVFDLLYGANFGEAGDDTLDGFNVHTLALQVPKGKLRTNGDGSGIVGVWTTAERQSTRIQFSDGHQEFSGDYVQVSRLGMPLVNEVVVPVGSKDYFNASQPTGDALYLPKVEDPEVPHLINSIYGIGIPDCDPTTPEITRDCDLVPVFLTGIPGLNQPPSVTASEMLRLNMTIAPCDPNVCATYSPLGVIGGDVAGFPNGRRLADDVIDVSLRVVEGVLIDGHDPAADTLGDGVDVNDAAFFPHFPYVALPHAGSDSDPHVGLRKV
jgi:Domain of unknown function (DUF4331)